ncbi:MAG: EamA family transporter RarD [Verrucomicrobia bacterium]|nr:EamA family transporter RarD [Verrucomicrobiota bacterium]
MPRGVWLALGAYGLWGVLPVYWKWLQAVPAPQILAHRVVWSFLFLLGLIFLRRDAAALWRSVDRRNLAAYAMASALLSVNWLTYIWAVNAGRIVETSLGYFINPLVSVLLGVVFFRERLRPWQWLAVGVAALGVTYLTWQHGALPWVALVLAGTFAFYGLLKKKAPLGSLPGLAFETGILWLPAVAFLLAVEAGGNGQVGRATVSTWGLLVFTGVVTGLPLLMFSAAARRISLSTIGLLQYVAPSCQLLIGVAVYHEPFDRVRWVGFTLIWTALAIYSIESLWRMKWGAAGAIRK